MTQISVELRDCLQSDSHAKTATAAENIAEVLLLEAWVVPLVLVMDPVWFTIVVLTGQINLPKLFCQTDTKFLSPDTKSANRVHGHTFSHITR